jgi:NAD(P)H-dependent FMN reductase
LPAFNPDLDTDTPPDVVHVLRQKIGSCDGLLISSPEYARGLPGSLKNALDWLVSSFEFSGKPVAVINTSSRAVEAQAQLRLIVTTMSARLIDEASISLPLLGRNLDAESIVANPVWSIQLSTALRNFVGAIHTAKIGQK